MCVLARHRQSFMCIVKHTDTIPPQGMLSLHRPSPRVETVSCWMLDCLLTLFQTTFGSYVRACVRACVRVCVYVCVCMSVWRLLSRYTFCGMHRKSFSWMYRHHADLVEFLDFCKHACNCNLQLIITIYVPCCALVLFVVQADNTRSRPSIEPCVCRGWRPWYVVSGANRFSFRPYLIFLSHGLVFIQWFSMFDCVDCVCVAYESPAAQEVLKAVSGKDVPLKNVVTFNGNASEAIVLDVHP
jgi:hypothetical protein